MLLLSDDSSKPGEESLMMKFTLCQGSQKVSTTFNTDYNVMIPNIHKLIFHNLVVVALTPINNMPVELNRCYYLLIISFKFFLV